MKVYLLRHGDAVASSIDPQRSLSSEGLRDVQRIAQYLKDKGITVKDILHSTKKRAKQTAEIVQKAIAPEARLIEKNYLSPNDSLDDLIQELSQVSEDLMIVSHLPFLPRLASHLTTGDENKASVNFRTAGLSVLEKKDPNHWTVIWSISPDLI